MSKLDKEIEELKLAMEYANNFVDSAKSLSNLWNDSDVVNQILNKMDYPLDSSFDEVVIDLEEWREGINKRMEEHIETLNNLDRSFYITLEMIQQTIGFEAFKAYLQKHYYEDYTFWKKEGQYSGDTEWKITKKDARALGFPIK